MSVIRSIGSCLVALLLLAAGSHAQYTPHPGLGTSRITEPFTPKVTRYDLVITDTIVNYTGKA
ncbi:MAG TPA: hypothetical protein PJ983_06870, partial [Flavobacteriales bacterium]|nr:hypothetical protein [Flavobacteriales bacterium]